MGRATGTDVRPDSRAVAAADLDRDGRVDLVIATNNGPPVILMNQLATAGQWVELELVGSRSNRDAVGAAARLTAGGRTMVRTVEAGSGYAAQSAHALHFGLAQVEELDSLEVRWPSGEVREYSGPALRDLLPINIRSRLGEDDEGAATEEAATMTAAGGAIHVSD